MLEKEQKEIEKLREEVGYSFDKNNMKDTMGRFWTQGLFKEMSYGKPRNCIMTFKNEDFGDLVSFKRIFVELGDPSGYIPAMVLFSSWDHWLKLCDCPWFLKELKLSMDELEVKLRAEALIEIKEISQGTSGSALSAAKYIASGTWRAGNNPKGKVGRPQKGQCIQDTEKEKKIVSLVQQETNRDYERLGLGKVETESSNEGR